MKKKMVTFNAWFRDLQKRMKPFGGSVFTARDRDIMRLAWNGAVDYNRTVMAQVESQRVHCNVLIEQAGKKWKKENPLPVNCRCVLLPVSDSPEPEYNND